MIMLRRFLYIVMLFVVMMLNFLYIDYQFMMVLILMLVILLVDFLLYLASSHGVSVYTKDMDEGYHIGSRIAVMFVYGGRLSISVPNAQSTVEIRYSNDNGRTEVHSVSAVQGRCGCRFRAKHAGVVYVSLVKLTIVDYLKMFSKDMEYSYTKKIYVHPDILDLYSMQHSIVQDVEFIRRSFYENDNTEVVDLRAYQQSDTLNRIHWKRSSYEDDYIVKQFGETVKNSVRILVDLSTDEVASAEYTDREVLDRLYMWTMSVSMLCVNNEIAGSICVWDKSIGDYSVFEFADENDVYGVMERLYEIKPTDTKDKLGEIPDANGNTAESFSILITAAQHDADESLRVINVMEEYCEK